VYRFFLIYDGLRTMSTPKRNGNLLEAALSYAVSNLPVFPCQLDKRPYTEHGFLDAVCDQQQIREWWTKRPEASIGMPTGIVSGRIVIDVDPRHGGYESLLELEKKYGALPPTLETKTGGGGRHLFFVCRGPDVRNSAGVLGPGVDVRGEGGYVILPPSPHPSGTAYEWVNKGQSPVVMPPWLEAQLTKPRGAAGANGAGNKIPAGGRNQVLTSLAGAMRRKGASEESILEALLAENESRCDPPLPEREIQTIANSVSRYEPAEQSNQLFGRVAITENSNAERLVRTYGDEIRFCSDRRVWAVWNGTYWAVNDEGGAMRRMQEVSRNIYTEAGTESDDYLRKALGRWASQSEARRTQENSVALARWFKEIEVRRFGDIFDRHPLLLNVANGTIDLESGELRPHRREDFITKIVNIEYGRNASCPKFSKCLDEWLPAQGLAGYMARFMGYCLTGLTSEQAWFLFHGVTASGKSTLLNILRGILGPYALQLPENYFLATKNMNDFATANLAGVRLATCVETNDGRRLDVAKIKHLTGGDPVCAALKFQNFFEFIPEYKLVLATNHAPRVPDTDDSIWRRIRVVAFLVTIPETRRIPELADRLLQHEGPGILRLAVIGCQAWLQNRRLSEPDAVTKAGAEYRAAEDVVRHFVEECYVLEPKARSSRKDVYHDYVAWCEEGGLKPVSKKKFAEELKRMGVDGDEGDRFWLGIRKADVVS
jgi:putative DNA primase/helicase